MPAVLLARHVSCPTRAHIYAGGARIGPSSQCRGVAYLLRLAARAEDNGTHIGAEEAGHADAPDVQDEIKKLLADDPETQARLERVRQAAAAVAALQAQKAELDKETTAANYASAWEAQDQERRQAQRAAERGAGADILSAADDLEQAQAELVQALQEQSKWSVSISEDAQRVESAKAGAVAAIGATISSLPVILAAGNPPLIVFGSLGSIFVSGLLFGVTYRYAVRSDLSNLQLKSGVLAAFGLIRGLALAEEILKTGDQVLSAEIIGAAAIAAGESMLSAGFAAAALELAFRRGFVKPFGTKADQ